MREKENWYNIERMKIDNDFIYIYIYIYTHTQKKTDKKNQQDK